MSHYPHGLIDQSAIGRKNDYLYRISIKGLILNNLGQVLVVKESGRSWWDLPGGGMDHGEDIRSGLSRELKEEINLEGDFVYKVIAVDEPMFLPNANVYQVRIIFHIQTVANKFSAGVDADEVRFLNLNELKMSHQAVERKIYEYAQMLDNV